MTPRPEEIHINVTADWDDRILDYLRRKVGLYGEEPIEMEARGAVAWGKNYDPPQGQGWYPKMMKGTMLHILENGWWVPEDEGESLVGRIIHLSTVTKPNTARLPEGQRGTWPGQTVVLRCGSKTVRVWLVEGQVTGVRYLQKGHYAKFICTHPDTGYSERRYYKIYPARKREMTRLAIGGEVLSEAVSREGEAIDPGMVRLEETLRVAAEEFDAANAARLHEYQEEQRGQKTSTRVDVFSRMFVEAALAGALGEATERAVRIYAELIGYNIEEIRESLRAHHR